jgi:hypothetical protein
MLLELLGNMIEIFSRLDEIEKDNGNQHSQHHCRDGRYEKENVRFHQCIHEYSILHNSAALQKADDDQDERDHEQCVDQSAERDGGEKPQSPENDQDYDYCPHKFSPPFLLVVLVNTLRVALYFSETGQS